MNAINQLPSLSTACSASPLRAIASDAVIDAMLARDCVVAVGVSGGKDSVACALAVSDHLDAIGHNGPRVLVHADLGMVEWKDSLPTCRRLADLIGWKLIVVARPSGGMMERWESRWAANVGRYSDLSCVKIIMPWSSPVWRFCTSELKTAPITSNLKKLYPGKEILNVVGIRRQESSARAKKPVWSAEPKLSTAEVQGANWNPIIEWTTDQVFARIEAAGLTPHEAYTKYGSSRVSCAFCIMASLPDLTASANCEDNQEIYVRMVELEVASTFAFQGARWLADVAPHLLPPALFAKVADAKARATYRQEIEKQIPEHLLFVKGAPVAIPTLEEAATLAAIRTSISGMLGIEAHFTSAAEIVQRYVELLDGDVPAAREMTQAGPVKPVKQFSFEF